MNANKKQRLTKSERRSIKTARRTFRNVKTHETEKFLVAASHRRLDGVSMKSEDWS